MPVLGALVVVIQLCFAYHALKTGRARWWLFEIVAFPVAGCVLPHRDVSYFTRTPRPWFETARNYAMFANKGGAYGDLA